MNSTVNSVRDFAPADYEAWVATMRPSSGRA